MRLTTRGFRYVLDLGRDDIPKSVNLFRWSKPDRPITVDRVFEIDERIGHDGSVLQPLDPASILRAIEAIRSEGVQAIAIALLHSYANPRHEQAVAAAAPQVLSCFLPVSRP